MEIKEAKKVIQAGLAWANWTEEQQTAMRTALQSMETLEQIKEAYEDRVGDIESLEESLWGIDTHIRSTDDPVPHIIKILKDTLPEYHLNK